jgi:hypothetical protein
MKKLYLFAVLLLSLGSIFLMCSSSIAGNSSETQNGKVVASAHLNSICVKTEPGALVAIFDSSYNPLDTNVNARKWSDSLITGFNGSARFTSLPRGNYHIIVWDSSSTRGAFLGPLWSGADGDFKERWASLRRLGRAVGTLELDSNGAGNLGVYLVGTPFISAVDSDGRFKLDRLPQGKYLLKNYYLRKMDTIGDTTFSGAPVGVGLGVAVEVEPGVEVEVSR